MTVSELFANERVTSALLTHAPLSVHTGRALTLVDLSHWVGLGHLAQREGPVHMQWQNSMEAQWWYGADAGVYTHQIRQDVSDEELLRAGLTAGLAKSEILHALAGRASESAERFATWKAQMDAQAAQKRAIAEQTQRTLEEQDEAMPPGWTRKPGTETWRNADGYVVCWNTGTWAIDRSGRRLHYGFTSPAAAAVAVAAL